MHQSLNLLLYAGGMTSILPRRKPNSEGMPSSSSDAGSNAFVSGALTERRGVCGGDGCDACDAGDDGDGSGCGDGVDAGDDGDDGDGGGVPGLPYSPVP